MVRLVECPRDAWQALPQQIPAHVKADYLRALLRAGFRTIDAVSFVSPAAVPQMADAEEVLEQLAEEHATTLEDTLLAIVVNQRGVERALATGMAGALGFPYSVSPTFLQRNQKQTPEQATDALEGMLDQAFKNGLDTVAYISMAFGNPYGDAWSVQEVIDACELLVDMGVGVISLADTVGLATDSDVERLVGAVMAADVGAEIGVHLHARPDAAAGKILAAYRAGCRRFDTALGGMGGCPFAQDALVGNIATETAIETLKAAGAELPPITGLEMLVRLAKGIAVKFGAVEEEMVH